MIVGILVAVAVVKWYVQTKENEMRRVYMMVDRILGELLATQTGMVHTLYMDKKVLVYIPRILPQQRLMHVE